MRLAITVFLSLANLAFTEEVLHFELPMQLEEEKIADHVLDLDPDIVQITKVSTKQANKLYSSLQHGYAHFLYVPSSQLLIASKNDVRVIPAKADVEKRGEVRADFSFGPNGTKVDVSASAGIHDGRGNHVGVEVSKRDDGSKGVSVRAGHDDSQDKRGTRNER